jgi:hypothetical protein
MASLSIVPKEKETKPQHSILAGLQDKHDLSEDPTQINEVLSSFGLQSSYETLEGS